MSEQTERFVMRKAGDGQQGDRGIYRASTTFNRGCAMVGCPDCGLNAQLAHDIDAHGVVTPTFQCAREGCGFEEDLRLDNWDFGAIDRSGNRIF